MFDLALSGNVTLLMFLHSQSSNELRYQYEDLTHEQLIEQMKRSYEKAGAELRRVGYFQPTGTIVATMEGCQPGRPER